MIHTELELGTRRVSNDGQQTDTGWMEGRGTSLLIPFGAFGKLGFFLGMIGACGNTEVWMLQGCLRSFSTFLRTLVILRFGSIGLRRIDPQV